MKKYSLAGLGLLLAFSATQAESPEAEKFYDNFAGTVSQRSGQLFLKRCDLTAYEYPMHFNHAEEQSKIAGYLKRYPKFWVNIRGDVHAEKEVYHLTVEEVSELYPGESCHLTDLLDELTAPAENPRS
ncbi:hypothetical protein [Acinetobacter sp.]|uniref:hypothetical protein n=1 Tax=Acinetobacter sp. TaxID=472 RepID=UPI002FCC21E2